MYLRTTNRISLRLFLSCIVCVFAVSGCMSISELAKVGTTYHDSNNKWKLGYSDTQLNDNNVYRVSYAGYSIPQSLCDDFALMRAAEISKQKGFRYFRVLDEKQSSSSQSIALPDTTGIGLTMNYPVTTITIELRKDSEASLNIMDAETIWKSLSATHLTDRK